MNKLEQINSIFPTDIPEQFKLVENINQDKYLNNGDLCSWQGEKQDVYSPVYIQTESGLEQKLIGHYPLLTEKEAMEALDSAVTAYNNGRGTWPSMSTSQRIKHMQKFVEGMKSKRDQVVNLLMWEIGKSFQDSQKEFDRTVDYINQTIEALKNLDHDSSKFIVSEGIIAQIRRVPLGTVLCMGPYNYPLNETYTTLIPALIMGNTIVFKPPKHGVLLHYPLLEVFKNSFPAGVVNTVYGRGQKVIPVMMESGKIDVLAFIGSSKVANSLKKQHPALHRLRCIFGLDAKNPAIVLADADLEQTVKECILGSLSYNGQRCTALKILFVHKDIVEQFLNKFSEMIDQLKCGMPWDKDVNITPLPEPNKPQYLLDVIEDAKKLGAKVINQFGGTTNNSFVYPALVYPVTPEMRLYNEEQFGPVIPVIAFDDINQPIQYMIESNFGQQVSIFGNDTTTIAQLIDQLVSQVCRININSQCQRGPDIFPFSGRKDSAETTLSVSDALRAFSIRTMVATKSSEKNKEIITEIVTEHHSAFLSTDFIL